MGKSSTLCTPYATVAVVFLSLSSVCSQSPGNPRALVREAQRLRTLPGWGRPFHAGRLVGCIKDNTIGATRCLSPSLPALNGDRLVGVVMSPHPSIARRRLDRGPSWGDSCVRSLPARDRIGAHVNLSARGPTVKHIPRRKFLFDSLGGAAAVGAAASLAIRTSSASPNDQLGVSIIGVGGMGHGHVRRLLPRSDVRFVSLCDIDQARLERAGQTVNRDRRTTPKLQTDFRDVLADRDVDAVVVATPHHWHCPIAIPAMQAGKDVYIEKPASHVFREGRLLVDAARKYDRIVQHGTQMRSSDVTKRADELLKNGVIGEVKMSKAWNCQKPLLSKLATA